MEKSLSAKISKNLWSRIFEFFDMRNTLRYRVLSKAINSGISHLWRLKLTECEVGIEIYENLLVKSKETEEGKLHLQITNDENILKKKIKKTLRKAESGGMLFKSFKDVSYLVKPSKCIVYPVYFTWLLLGNKEIKYENLADLWFKIKHIMKDPNLYDKILNIPMQTISERTIEKIQQISRIHHDGLQKNIIRTICKVCAYLFVWSHKIIEHYRLYKKLIKCPITEICSKLEVCKKMKLRIEKVFNKIMLKFSDH